MKPEVILFASLCVDRGMMDSAACRMLRDTLGEEVEIIAFAETMMELGISQNPEMLQEILDVTAERLECGIAPSHNPFEETAPRPRISLLKKNSAPVTPLPPVPASGSAPAAATSSIPSPSLSTAEPAPRDPSPRTAFSAPVASSAETAPAPATQEKVEAEPTPRGHKGIERLAPSLAGVVAVTAHPALPDFQRLNTLSDEQLRVAMAGWLRYASTNGISDLHINAAARPFVRKARNLQYLSDQIIQPETARRLNLCLLTEAQLRYFEEAQDYDFAMALETGERYRVNLMVNKDGVAGTYRTIPSEVPSLEKLGFTPQHCEVIRKLLAYHNGLILVTGPVGSGKTTTLAAMIQELNNEREDHIITVEDPIEIIQRSHNCNITQRAVGPHTRTFHSALKGALRQDPDIIVIGEMRDLETIEMAISASETGHLVIGTMHTADSASTLNRLLDVFPPAQQTQIRAMVAESLRGIICQRLLPGTGHQMVLAVELLLKNTAVSNLIREGKSEGLVNVMETGKRSGMIRMDQAIYDLWQQGRISHEVAAANIQSKIMLAEISAKNASAAPTKKRLS